MSAKINLRHIEAKPVRLDGSLNAEELELESADEIVHPAGPLSYELSAEKIDKAILVRGDLLMPLRCECARCLKPFDQPLALHDWACHLSLEGEDAVKVDNDVIDLTPYIREDILLAFPQHPLCEPECKGLPNPWKSTVETPGGNSSGSAWAELNKLKL